MRIVIASGGALLASLAGPAVGQSVPIDSFSAPNDMRATVGISISLGSGRSQRAAEPKLDFRLQHHSYRADTTQPSRSFAWPSQDPVVRQMRLSWTLRRDSQFLLNSRPLSYGTRLNADGENSESEEREGRNTLQKIGLGAAIVGGVTVVALGVLIAPVLFDDECRNGC